MSETTESPDTANRPEELENSATFGPPLPESPPPLPMAKYWHALPILSGVLLLIYAFRHPNCWQWVSESGVQCLYLHLLLVAFFCSMIYFGDVLFKFRYNTPAERRNAGHFAGTALLALWDLVILSEIV